MNNPRILKAGIAALLALPGTLTAAERSWVANPGDGDWSNPANWNANGVPVSGVNDRIFVHTPGSVAGVAIDAEVLFMAVGTAAAPTSGYTFGAGTYNVGTIFVGEGHVGNGHGPAPINNAFGRAFINAGTTVNVGSFHLGEWDGASGHVIQSGGDLNIANQFRLGHWPQAGGARNSYEMNGGSITMTGVAADPLSEGSSGLVVLGIDSSGIFNMNGGTFTAHGMTMQTRGAGGGESVLNMNGGTLNIGVNGFVTSNPAALASYDINLRGGTIRSTANWTSTLEMHLVTGGSGVVFDTNGNNATLSGQLNGAGGLTKTGAGVLTLSGANTYSGATSVTGGTLAIGGASALGTGALSVGPGLLNLAAKGPATAINSVGPISLSGGTISLGVSGASSDQLASSGTISLAGTNTVNILAIGGIAGGTTYTLLSGTGFSGGGSLALGSTPAGFFTWTPNQTATAYQVTVAGAATPPVAYWAGSVSSVWSDASVAPTSNWRTDAAGATDTNQIPGSITDVFFATNTASNLTNTLGADFFINSLTLTSATTGAVTIGGANALTIGAGGLTRQAGAGSLTLNTASVALSGAQTWTNSDTGDAITVNAALTGAGALTKAASGLITLGGSNSGFTGDITVNAGTLRLANANAGGAASASLVANGTIDLAGNSLTKNSISGGSAGIITSSTAGTMTVASGSGVFAGVIENGSGTVALNKTGGGQMTLTGNNTYTGGTSITGTLAIGNGGATGAIGGGPITLNGTLAFATSNPNTITGNVNAGGPAGTVFLLANSDVTLASGTTARISSLQGGIGGQNDTLGGTLRIGPGSALVVQDSFTLGNTAGGGAESHTIISQTGGTVDVNAANTDGRNFVLGHWNQGRGTWDHSGGTLNSPNISMAISWDGNGTYNLSGTGVANVRGLRFGHNGSRSGVFNLTGGELNLGVEGIWEQIPNLPNDINLGGGTVRAAVNTNIFLPTELTGINGNTVFDTNGNSLSVGGVISGVGGMTKTGAGTLTLTNANTFTGPTTISGGTLHLGPAGNAAGTALTVQNGATLSTVNMGKTFDSLTIQNGAIFNLAAETGGTNTLTNALTLAGAPSFTIRPSLGGPVTAGQTFDLFTAGSVVGTAGTIITDFGFSHTSGHTAIFGNILRLTIDTASGILTWNNGAGTGNWVTNGDVNFTGADGKFLPNDLVNFGNTAAGTVTLVGDLAPSAVIVDSTADYTFSGAGRLVSGSLTKSGTSTLTLATVNSYGGGTTVNGGVLNLTGQNGGDGAIRGTVTVNAGAELRATGGGGAIFGYNTGAKVDTLNIVGGLVDSIGGDNHLWNATVNMTGGELRSNGGVNSPAGAAYQWSNTALNTIGSPTTAVISGHLNLRADNSNRFVATVANGAADPDLRVSAAITHTGVSIFKLGPGTMELTGGAAASSIRAVGGELTLSGTGTYAVGSIVVGEDPGLSGVAGTGEGTLNIRDSVVVTTGTISMGENLSGAFQTNVVNHSGGTVTTTGNSGEAAGFRLGHWPNEISTYNLSGAGTLSLTDPNGGLAIATDGTGIFHQTGGTLNTPQIVVNHRNGGGSAAFDLEGGTANIGAGGIVTAGGPAATNLGGGTIRATAADLPISAPVTLTGTNGDVSFDTNGNTITITGPISGIGGFVKTGPGRMVLNSANTATGIFVVNEGVLSAQGAHANNRIPAGGLVQINSGGTFEFGSVNSAAFTANYIVGPGGILTNAAGVDHAHLGSVQLNGGTWTTDPAAISYNGENYQLEGNVSVGGFIPSLITQQGGTAADRGIAWNGAVTFDVADVTGDEAADLTVSTELENSDSGSATLIKNGDGTMHITFAATYSGATTVNAGTLRIDNTVGSGTGTGNVTIGAGGKLAGTGTVGSGGAVSVSLSGRLAPGNSAGTLAFNLGAGALDISGVPVGGLEFELGTTSDLVALTSGSLTLGTGLLEFDDFSFTQLAGFANGDYVLFDTSSPITGTFGPNTTGSLGGIYSGTLQFADGGNDLVLRVVPEPGSALLILGGLGLLAARRRRDV